jgi:hypothetical protein
VLIEQQTISPHAWRTIVPIVPLQVLIDSPGCDTVLLINAPDGSWHYDDDS